MTKSVHVGGLALLVNAPWGTVHHCLHKVDTWCIIWIDGICCGYWCRHRSVFIAQYLVKCQTFYGEEKVKYLFHEICKKSPVFIYYKITSLLGKLPIEEEKNCLETFVFSKYPVSYI